MTRATAKTLVGVVIACAIVLPAVAGPVADRVRFALTPIDSQPTTQQLNRR